jgi:hypothetical protein
MKTEELIDLLSTNIEPVDTQKVVRDLRIAIVAGLVLAALTCIVTLGIRPDLNSTRVFGFLLVTIGFGTVATALGWPLLLKHARPGGENQSRIFLTVVPFAALMVLAYHPNRTCAFFRVNSSSAAIRVRYPGGQAP